MKETIDLHDDAPSKIDEFTEGGHSRTAQTLSDLITSDALGTCAIGLEGGWGSGKSTVIELSEVIVSEHHNSPIFFKFDMWRSELNEIKSVFLVEFIDFLKRSNILSSEKEADSIARQLKGQTVRLERENETQLGIWGLAAALFAPLVPVILAWLNVFEFNTGPGEVRFLFDIPVSLISSMITFGFIGIYLAILVNIIINIINKKPIGHNIIFSSSSENKTIVNEYIESTEPAFFNARLAMNSLLEKRKSNKDNFVIVLDNIDRVPDSHCDSMWSFVREISSPHPTDDESVKVSFVVPFDRRHLLAMQETAERDNAAQNVDAFLDKTFRIRIFVPLPLLSDWKNYFFSKCSFLEGSKDDPEGKIFATFRVFEWWLNEKAILPTPRIIKSNLNEVNILWRQWEGSIPPQILMAFVLLKNEFDDLKVKVASLPDVYPALVNRFRLREWPQFLAAVQYNVPPNSALQIVIGRDIRTSLQKANFSELQRISSVPGFFEVFSEIYEDGAFALLEESQADFANLISETANFAVPAYEQVEILRGLLDVWRSGSQKRILYDEIDGALSIIVARLPESEIAAFVQELLAASIVYDVSSDLLSAAELYDVGIEWGVKALAICGISSAKSIEVDMRFPRLDSVPAAAALGVAKAIGGRAIAPNELLRRGGLEQAHLDAYIGLIREGNQTRHMHATLSVIESGFTKDSFKLWVDGLGEQLSLDATGLPSHGAIEVIQSLVELRRIGADRNLGPSHIDTVLSDLVHDGTAAFFLQKAVKTSNIELKRAIAYLIITSGLDRDLPPNNHPKYGDIGDAIAQFNEFRKTFSPDPSEAVEVGKLLSRSNEWGSLFALLAGAELTPLVVATAQTLRSATSLGNRLNTGDVALGLPALANCCPNATVNALQILSGWSDKIVEALCADLSKIGPELISAISSSQSKLANSIRTKVREDASSRSMEEWLEDLRSPSPGRLEVYSRFHAISAFKIRNTELRKAILAYLDDLAKNEHIHSSSKLNFQSLISFTHDMYTEKLARDILDKVRFSVLVPESSVIIFEAIQYFDLWEAIVDRTDVLTEKIVIPILEAKNPVDLRRLIEARENLQKTFSEIDQKRIEELSFAMDQIEDEELRSTLISSLPERERARPKPGQ
jgi:hypothetical protein